MDKSRLSLAVYKRTGFALDPGDPAFALIELNRLVLEELLEEAVGRLAQQLNALPDRIQSSSTAVASELASQGVQRVVEMLIESRRTIASDVEQAQQRIAEQAEKMGKVLAGQVAAVVRAAQTVSRGGAARVRWLLAGATIGVVSCTGGFMAGQLPGTHNLFQQSAGR